MQICEPIADRSLEVRPTHPEVQWLRRIDTDRPRRHLDEISTTTRFFKRAIDIVLASSMLVVLSPVLLLVAVLIRLTSPGPVLFRQVRVGLNSRRASRRGATTGPVPYERRRTDRRQQFGYGRPFTMYKFRTMRTDAERNGAQFATKGDPRVTRIGRFLRRTRLDELPQLWNILRGDMSMVGPRPERPEFVGKLTADIPDYPQRLGLKPGLTGLAQVVNGYDNDLDGFRRKIRYDLIYMENCSPGNDARILLRTFGVVISGKGAV
ncbi:sugar transferase [Thalassoroseus pseudoceratinae]|uniref:sugar transferase n=1 Tax=Thalassoroseus pseudoceratinae TaxID=2713176 RepID=UPI001F0E08B0|nr:sugar transferase [Thalassoroseus pseudoceratinae]